MSLIGTLVAGLRLGSVYAVIALGYTMVYGIAKMLNFAHGDVIMVGGYLCYIAFTRMGFGVLPAVLGAVVGCTLLGIVIERLAYKPLRSASSLAVLITAIGVSYFLQNAALLLWGSDTKVFPVLFQLPSVSLFGVDVAGMSLLTIAICVVIMIALTLFTEKTKMGKAMRAVSEDKGAAQLMGINVNATISATFAIGSGLAAVAGVLLCSSYQALYPTLGSMPGIKAFTAAVIGGVGSIPGAMLGGLLLGLLEIACQVYITTELSNAIVFGVLILVLMVKPTGLLGKTIQEKV